MLQTLIAPMAAHVALAATLYFLLTIARAPVVWGIGRGADGSNPWAALEPRISANLSSQFEWPVFFHVACLIFFQIQPDLIAVVLAWIFVGGRVLHSAVQIFTRNIRLQRHRIYGQLHCRSRPLARCRSDYWQRVGDLTTHSSHDDQRSIPYTYFQ